MVNVVESDRITIMLDTDLKKKIRNMQADQIKNSVGSVSFSHVVNQILRAYFE